MACAAPPVTESAPQVYTPAVSCSVARLAQEEGASPMVVLVMDLRRIVAPHCGLQAAHIRNLVETKAIPSPRRPLPCLSTACFSHSGLAEWNSAEALVRLQVLNRAFIVDWDRDGMDPLDM